MRGAYTLLLLLLMTVISRTCSKVVLPQIFKAAHLTFFIWRVRHYSPSCISEILCDFCTVSGVEVRMSWSQKGNCCEKSAKSCAVVNIVKQSLTSLSQNLIHLNTYHEMQVLTLTENVAMKPFRNMKILFMCEHARMFVSLYVMHFKHTDTHNSYFKFRMNCY